MVLTTALLCLATNIFFEARGEPPAGQQAVAAVTMNRAHHNADRVCGVVLAKGQFSWTSKHIEYVAGMPLVKNPGIYTMGPEEPAWRRAVNIAAKTIAGAVADNTRGATHYHANYVSPTWSGKAAGFVMTAQIGRHYFYRSNKSAVTII